MPVAIGGSGPITGVTSINTTVTDTELGYLDGVTSALQTQINAKSDATTTGLVKIKNQTISSAAASNITSAFSSTYKNYRIIVSDISGSGGSNANFTISLLSGSTEATSLYQYGQTSVNTAGTTGGAGSSSAASWLLGPVVYGNPAYSVIDLMNPFVADRTFFDSSTFGGYNSSTSAVTNYRSAGVNTNSSSYDGFRLAIASGTFSATVTVYGYLV